MSADAQRLTVEAVERVRSARPSGWLRDVGPAALVTVVLLAVSGRVEPSAGDRLLDGLAFTTGTSFAGTFVFVVFVGAIAVEFSRGTVRTMLLRQPRRGALLAGKLASLFTFAAVVLAVAEALTWIAATLLAPTQDIPTGEWRSLAAIGHALADYATVLFWVGGYALLGLTVAVLTRSVPVALAIGIAWAGPFEHLIQDGWNTATRVFPGLLLEAFVAGGTSDVSALRAFGTVAAYMLVAAAVAATTFVRRDVTA